MILNNLFESRYGAAAGVETIRQLLHAVKNSQDIDLKVGPEMFPLSYGDARYLLQYFKANREGGDVTAEYFGDANWIEGMLAKRDHAMSPDRLKDMDQERMKSKDYDRMLGIQEAEFEITYKDPQFTGTRTHTIKSVNAKKAQEKFSSFGNPYKVLGIKKKELEEYAIEPTSPQDKEAKMKSLQALLTDPNTSKDPELKRAVMRRMAQLSEDQISEGYPKEYKGWKYGEDVEQYDDVSKKFHYATKDGKQVTIDWSPYSTMSDIQFKTWIDLGMPTRKDVDSIGPLGANDLEQLMKTKLGTRARLAQEDKPMDIELDVLKYTDEQVSKAIAIARGSEGDMTGATERIEAMADGLSSHCDVAKVLKIANEAKDDDITKKLDPKTKIALKKAQMKSAGLTKGDPIASLAYGLEKDVDRLDKENDQEEADIASQELVDKYHSQELEQLKKSLTNILRK